MRLRLEYISKTKENRLYQLPIPIIGLTGGIATGKSTVAQMFKDLGLNVLDADSLVKKIYARAEAVDFVKANFPQAFQNNAIQFKILREIVFSDNSYQETVEKFIYSHLPQTFLNAFQELPVQNFIIYDVPLLFEKKLNESVDCSICVYASRETQIKRLTSRDHIDDPLAQQILAKQIDIETKKKLATITLDNSSNLEVLQVAFKKLNHTLFQ